MSNITVEDLGNLLAEEIAKNFGAMQNGPVVGELYYEWLIRKLEDEKLELLDSLLDLRAEFEEVQNKATAKALLDDQQIASLENRITKFADEYNILDRECARFKSSYNRVAEQKERQSNLIQQLRKELYQTQTRLAEIRRVAGCV